MKHKWIIAVFAAVFAAAVLLGAGIRIAMRPDKPPQPVTTPASEPASLPPSTEPAVTTLEPITSTEPITTPEPATEPPVTEPELEPEPPGEVRICIGGDTSIDGEFADFAAMKGVDYPWAEIKEVMTAADIAIVNLETCVSERGTSEKREGYGFRTPPEMLDGFANAGIDMVNLANNHTRDFGYDALLDTFTHLSERGIEYFGAGHDIDEAAGLRIVEKNGLKVGFAGANRVSLKADCVAAPEHAGINMIGEIGGADTEAFLQRIREYDSQCNVLIVFLHAGIEETFNINSYQKSMSRALIDAGADIVVGGHSHTLQPIEFYNDKLILYSIGNLIFWHIDDDIDGLTAIFDMIIDQNGFVSLKLHPLFIKNYKVYYLSQTSERYTQIRNLVNEICAPYGLWFDENCDMKAEIPEEILADNPEKNQEG